MENEKIDIEMADMVGKTYFKIATWYNEDFGSDKERQEALKHVSAEVIQQILEDAFMQIKGVNTGVKTVKNKETEENQTSTGTGKMFQVNEDPITRAIRENKD